MKLLLRCFLLVLFIFLIPAGVLAQEAEATLTTPDILPVPVLEEKISDNIAKESVIVGAIQTEVILNDYSQRAFRLTADSIENISTEQLAEGLVSWAFVPSSVDANNFLDLRQYAFDHFFGFTNDLNNMLIDDGQFILDEPARVVIFGWQCKTEECDLVEDISSMAFVSQELVNYHTIPVLQKTVLFPRPI